MPSNVKVEENVAEVSIELEKLAFLKLDLDFKIITIQEIGKEMSALVLEEKTTRQVRFLRAEFVNNSDESGKNLNLVQLGAMVCANEYSRS